MIGFNGGLIGAYRPTSAAASVPGVWTAREQEVAVRNVLWPGSTPDPFFSSVSLLLHGDGATIVDSSASNKTITAVGGVQLSTAQSKFGGSSILFNGTTGALTVLAAADCNFGTGDFTVEGWFYPLSGTNNANGVSLVAGRGPDTGTLMTAIVVNQIRIGRNAVAWDNQTSTLSWTTTWYHIAYSRTGSTIKFFRDGVSVLSASNTQNYNLTAGANVNFAIGARQAAGSGDSTLGEFFHGYMDEVRITKGVGRYTADFAVPTAPFPNF